MEKDIAIKVNNLTVIYKNFKNFSIKRNLLKLDTQKNDFIEAISDVSFNVKKGNILGIVGQNGSGKSTLLKTIGGVFSPDKGNIDLGENTVSLLSIGVGFQKEMTGRENIFLSGMLLGFSIEKIKENMEKIIEFSELGKFIDLPVKTYSSGMHSKLAFSITAFLETDILLIDEVLSVGDEKFKKKSLKKMKEIILDKDRTVVIVSHSIGTLRELCTEILWLHNGKLKMYGKPEKVLEEYLKFMV